MHKIAYEPTNLGGGNQGLKGTGAGKFGASCPPAPSPLQNRWAKQPVFFFAQNVNKQTYTRIDLAIIRMQLDSSYAKKKKKQKQNNEGNARETVYWCDFRCDNLLFSIYF